MSFVLELFLDIVIGLWRALATPQEVGTLSRIEWIGLTAATFVLVGMWIGQSVLRHNATFYPKDRFGLSLCWSLIAYAFFLAALLLGGWWRSGPTNISAVAFHLLAIVVALGVAVFLMPHKPGLR